jgi:hypothetical protein
VPARNCGWCGAYANQQPLQPQKAHEVEQRERETVCQQVFVCQACNQLSIATYIKSRNAGFPNWSDTYASADWLPFRGQRAALPDVPADIESAAQEAHICLTMGAHRASVMLVRSVIEATAKAHGITTRGVLPKIKEMAAAGLIHPSLARAADAVRVIANDSLHGDLAQPVTEQEAEDAFEVLLGIFAATFQSEARVERLTARQATALEEA